MTATAHAQYKGRSCVIFNELLAAGLFLALDGTSMRTDPSTSERKYRKSVNNAVLIRNESLFVVPATAKNASQLKHMPLSDTEHQIWENISRVALWEIP